MNNCRRLVSVAVTSVLCATVTAFQPIQPHIRCQQLALRSAVVDPPPKKPKKEKVTPEALELLDVLKEKEEGSKKLLIAQVAPSVRYASTRPDKRQALLLSAVLIDSHLMFEKKWLTILFLFSMVVRYMSIVHVFQIWLQSSSLPQSGLPRGVWPRAW